MSWKIKSIQIENFKYFHSAFPIDVNSRNLLVYGENGSGKSSVYWALYTLFQSRLKPDVASVDKYFDPTHDENLLNKYALAGDSSKVEVVFEDLDNPGDPPKTYVIERGHVTTQDAADTFFAFTIASSDFLNYKMLSKLADKENSVDNDVTDIVVKEIYPFADFATDYEDINGIHSGVLNAMRWHQYIMDAVDHLEHQTGKRVAHFDKNGPKYKKFQKLIRDFRNQLELYLTDISIRATQKLRDKFNIHDVEVYFEVDPVYKFDEQLLHSPRYRDHILHPLHIRLHAKLVNAQLAGGEAEIKHLRTFFNEAKLTCIGLAIRLAVVDKKYLPGGNLSTVLCLDDMLVSLDMSYRVPVTTTLLEYANNYQLCIFTHDRSLYNMMRNTIKELGYPKDKWKLLEFYRSDPAKEATEEPKVNCIEPKEGIEQVRAYMAQGDYPAAGNYLRKYAEGLIKSIIPHNQTFTVNNKGEVKNAMLRDLYNKSVATGKDSFCALYDITPAVMPDISKHLERLMNPLSHDDKDVPIFRRELDDAIAEVEKYEPIKAGKVVIVPRAQAGVRQFRMNMADGGTTKTVDFVTTEQWDYIIFPVPVGKKYKDCEVLITCSPDGTYMIDTKMRVKYLYEDMKARVFHGSVGAPTFDHCITDAATGANLSTL